MAVKQIEWLPESIFNIECIESSYACILLNRPISFDPTTFQQLWNQAKVRILVDGGANRWFKFIAENNLTDNIEVPNYLCGDMDSVTEESSQRLKEMKCQRLYTPDQDETDLTKSLIATKSHLKKQNIENVLIFTDFSGRIDHTISQINTLFKMKLDKLYLLSNNTLAWLLLPGKHRISVPQRFVEEQIWCAHIPIGSSCCVTTRGLKWDLVNRIVEFGGIVSTSNTYKSSIVEIECDGTLFWSMGTDSK